VKAANLSILDRPSRDGLSFIKHIPEGGVNQMWVADRAEVEVVVAAIRDRTSMPSGNCEDGT
jgi:hypothetical protein